MRGVFVRVVDCVCLHEPRFKMLACLVFERNGSALYEVPAYINVTVCILLNTLIAIVYNLKQREMVSRSIDFVYCSYCKCKYFHILHYLFNQMDIYRMTICGLFFRKNQTVIFFFTKTMSR